MDVETSYCFACKLREKVIEVGTKQLSDKGGMKKVASLVIGAYHDAPADFVERIRWKEQKLKELLVCACCFRWFFTATEVCTYKY